MDINVYLIPVDDQNDELIVDGATELDDLELYALQAVLGTWVRHSRDIVSGGLSRLSCSNLDAACELARRLGHKLIIVKANDFEEHRAERHAMTSRMGKFTRIGEELPQYRITPDTAA